MVVLARRAGRLGIGGKAMTHVSRAVLRLSMLVGLALSSLILSGCSSGPTVDPTQWRPYRLATTTHDSQRGVRRAAQSPQAPTIQATGGQDGATTGAASGGKPWPRRGTREWDELQAREAEQENRVNAVIHSICRGC